jgi:hypothetical protein
MRRVPDVLVAASSARRMLFIRIRKIIRNCYLATLFSMPKGQIMRNNHILHGVGLTLVGTWCLSICSAAPQTQSASLSPLIPKTASGSIGFDSGLWRSEYLQQSKQDKGTTKASATEVVTTVTTSGTTNTPPPAFVYSDKLVTIPHDAPAVMDTHGVSTNGESDEQGEATMSEWDNAVAKSGASATPGFTASGPSVISAVVGFVGIMTVIGAYVSSGKRNR